MIDRIFLILRSPYTGLVCRVVLGVVLIYAGINKSMDMDAFSKSVANFRIIPYEYTNILAVILPSIEILTGISLIAGLGLNGGITMATLLFIVFVIAVESAILRGLDIECGCFGTVDAQVVGIKTVLRNMIFVLATVPLWMSRERIFAVDNVCCRKKENEDVEGGLPV